VPRDLPLPVDRSGILPAAEGQRGPRKECDNSQAPPGRLVNTLALPFTVVHTAPDQLSQHRAETRVSDYHGYPVLDGWPHSTVTATALRQLTRAPLNAPSRTGSPAAAPSTGAPATPSP